MWWTENDQVPGLLRVRESEWQGVSRLRWRQKENLPHLPGDRQIDVPQRSAVAPSLVQPLEWGAAHMDDNSSIRVHLSAKPPLIFIGDEGLEILQDDDPAFGAFCESLTLLVAGLLGSCRSAEERKRIQDEAMNSIEVVGRISCIRSGLRDKLQRNREEALKREEMLELRKRVISSGQATAEDVDGHVYNMSAGQFREITAKFPRLSQDDFASVWGMVTVA